MGVYSVCLVCLSPYNKQLTPIHPPTPQKTVRGVHQPAALQGGVPADRRRQLPRHRAPPLPRPRLGRLRPQGCVAWRGVGWMDGGFWSTRRGLGDDDGSSHGTWHDTPSYGTRAGPSVEEFKKLFTIHNDFTPEEVRNTPACLRACVPACLRACMPACLRWGWSGGA